MPNIHLTFTANVNEVEIPDVYAVVRLDLERDTAEVIELEAWRPDGDPFYGRQYEILKEKAIELAYKQIGA